MATELSLLHLLFLLILLPLHQPFSLRGGGQHPLLSLRAGGQREHVCAPVTIPACRRIGYNMTRKLDMYSPIARYGSFY